MNGKERMIRQLRHEPVDRIACFEHFWDETHKTWEESGHLKPGESYADHFQFDMEEFWAFNLTADLDWKPQIVAETEETITYLDGNQATMK